MQYDEVIENARKCIGRLCRACSICNGVACRNTIPGPGSKGIGDTAIRNYNKWKEIRVNMDTIFPMGETDTSLSLFGRKFRYPFFAGPVGAVSQHYSDAYDDLSYNDLLVKACAEKDALMEADVFGSAPEALEKLKECICNTACGAATYEESHNDVGDLVCTYRRTNIY